MKIIKIGLKWVHMARYELILRLDGALWLPIISGPLLTQKWPIKWRFELRFANCLAIRELRTLWVGKILRATQSVDYQPKPRAISVTWRICMSHGWHQQTVCL